MSTRKFFKGHSDIDIVTSNSPSQDYTHPDDHNLPNYNFKQANRTQSNKTAILEKRQTRLGT